MDERKYVKNLARYIAHCGAEIAYRHKELSIEELQDMCDEHIEGWIQNAINDVK